MCKADGSTEAMRPTSFTYNPHAAIALLRSQRRYPVKRAARVDAVRDGAGLRQRNGLTHRAGEAG